ncbi:hypothetical protein [Mesorhizobium onobrychidis]|uniref:Uncharacterized protein n=1 Tax=Mesorhizobium onobrychidis TaxID=2775404 RepID=A0ABY5QUI6_9HYPH|nr:hypothetical protein [Mesorhizobium onobrychidis]UVC14845.1 hypothetical protein IHQ72_30265 [Mesorhizobium onobrychidis]
MKIADHQKVTHLDKNPGPLAHLDGRLPFPGLSVRPIPFHAFRQVGVVATRAWLPMLDAFER